MSDPFRLRVMDALAAAVADTVNGTGEYTFDLSGASFFGRATYGASDPETMANLLEDPREAPTEESDAGSGSRTSDWKLLLQGVTPDSAAKPTGPAYRLAAELQLAITTIARANADRADTVLGAQRKVNVVQRILVGAPVVRPPDENSAKSYTIMVLTLKLVEDPARPFT